MIALDATNEHPATSLGRFFVSHAKAYHAMANAPMKASSADTRTMVDFEAKEMHKLHLEGVTLSELGRRYSLTPAAVAGRFNRRGLEVIRHGSGRKPYAKA